MNLEKQVQVRFTAEDHERLKGLAKDEDRTVSSMIRIAVRAFIKERDE